MLSTLNAILGCLAIGSVQGVAIQSKSAVSTSILQARDVIGHDDVEPFPETIQLEPLGSLVKQFQPFLKVQNGCVPFPAIDINGNTG